MSRSGCGFLVLLSALAVVIFPCGFVFGQGWSGPEMISSGARDADTPQVAVGPGGQAVAAFSESSQIGEFDWIYRDYANFFDGESWGTVQRIDAIDYDSGGDPVVAMDASGNALAAFKEGTSATRVYGNHWDGSAWSAPAPIDPGLPGDTGSPDITMDGSGNAVAVYVEDTTYDIIHASRWDGSAWHQLDTVSWNVATTNADSPGIGMDRSGNAIAVWRQAGSPSRIYGRHWNGTAWGSITPIDMDWPSNALSPSVVMDGNGNALAVFYNYDGASDQRGCATWWNGSAWSPATTIDNDTGTSVTALKAALNAKGEAVAVFNQFDGSKNRVWATRWDGLSWSGATTIDSGLWTNAQDASVAIDGAGRAVAAFTEFSETGSFTGPRKLYAAVYDGSAWSAPARVDRVNDLDSSAHPQVAIDPSGHAIVVFDQEDGYDKHVYANRYVFPSLPSSAWNYDFNGDGTSDIAIFRETTGLWAVRSLTRVYFGRSGDVPVPGDYNGNGTTDLAVFRDSTGLWAVRDGARAYFGGSTDTPLPRDYNGNGTSDIAIFRGSSGLWAVRGLTRAYFGAAGDEPISGDFQGYGTAGIGIFRAATGLWAARSGVRIYFGRAGDLPVLSGYDSYPALDPAIFRDTTGLWAVRSITRAYFGTVGDVAVPADYEGDGVADIGIFRPATGLWAIRNHTRVYFGGSGDLPVAR